jgi:hypothetical protein
MKKKITLYYDDNNKNDVALLEYIDDIKGKSSRTAFIMNTLNDLKSKKLTYEKAVPQYIIQGSTNANESKKEEVTENKIDEVVVDNFKKKFGK